MGTLSGYLIRMALCHDGWQSVIVLGESSAAEQGLSVDLMHHVLH
jgi:hypothetical protein